MCIVIYSINYILLILEKSELNLKEVKEFAQLYSASKLEVLELKPRFSFRVYILHYSTFLVRNTVDRDFDKCLLTEEWPATFHIFTNKEEKMCKCETGPKTTCGK